MDKTQHRRLKRLEDRLNPTGKWRNTFTRFEDTPIPDGFDPALDRLITFVEVDMRVYHGDRRG